MITIGKSTNRIVHDWKLIPFLKSKGNLGRVLDVGSKDARYKKHMEFDSYKTLDVDPSFKCDYTADLEFFVSPEKFDTILITQVLEHVKNPEICIKSMSNLLKDGGRVISTTPFVFQNHGSEDYWRYGEPCLRMLFGRYFSKVSVVGYGNAISSSWDVLHFFNRIPLINYFVAFCSKIMGSNHAPNGFLVEAIK